MADVAALGLLDSVIVYEQLQGMTACRIEAAVHTVKVSDGVLSATLLQPHQSQPPIPILPLCEVGRGPGGGEQPLTISELTYVLHVSLQEGRGNRASQDTLTSLHTFRGNERWNRGDSSADTVCKGAQLSSTLLLDIS